MKSQDMPDRTSENMLGRTSEDKPDRMEEDMQDRNSKSPLQRIPNGVTKDMVDRMPSVSKKYVR